MVTGIPAILRGRAESERKPARGRAENVSALLGLVFFLGLLKREVSVCLRPMDIIESLHRHVVRARRDQVLRTGLRMVRPHLRRCDWHESGRGSWDAIRISWRIGIG